VQFDGGYNTQRHGTMCGCGYVNATQLECVKSVRQTLKGRRNFATAFAESLAEFFKCFYGVDITQINLQSLIKNM